MDRRKFLTSTRTTALSSSVLPFLKFTPAEAAPAATAVGVIGQTINSLVSRQTFAPLSLTSNSY